MPTKKHTLLKRTEIRNVGPVGNPPPTKKKKRKIERNRLNMPSKCLRNLFFFFWRFVFPSYLQNSPQSLLVHLWFNNVIVEQGHKDRHWSHGTEQKARYRSLAMFLVGFFLSYFLYTYPSKMSDSCFFFFWGGGLVFFFLVTHIYFRILQGYFPCSGEMRISVVSIESRPLF